MNDKWKHWCSYYRYAPKIAAIPCQNSFAELVGSIYIPLPFDNGSAVAGRQ